MRKRQKYLFKYSNKNKKIFNHVDCESMLNLRNLSLGRDCQRGHLHLCGTEIAHDNWLSMQQGTASTRTRSEHPRLHSFTF